jgi:hypothetical protein
MQPPKYITDWGVLEGWGLPADLTDEEAAHITKARHDAIMDVFDRRMEALNTEARRG